WFVPKIQIVGKYKIVGLIHIKQVYHYENNYLVNEFQRDFNFPSNVKISSRQVEFGFPIFNNSGMYIFSLVFDNTCEHPLFQLYFPVVSYFAAIILFGFFLSSLINDINNPKAKRYVILITAVLILLGKYLASFYQFPAIFYELDLFHPQNMAISQFLPSLGDLLLWVMVVFFMAYLIHKNLRNFSVNFRQRKIRIFFISLASLVITIAFFL
ncbi:MAG: hypothetical protein HC830_10385, partial [Bacteroidetes bacterium]|nr:hypothetical protein [Bacteroidota bacterium]